MVNRYLEGDRKPPLPLAESAQNTLRFAHQEAQGLLHNYIGTEHLLLGMLTPISDAEGEHLQPAGIYLQAFGLDLEKSRFAVEKIIGKGDRLVMGETGLTPRAHKVVELATAYAQRRGHTSITDVHLLLGLIEEAEGIAVGVMSDVAQIDLDALWFTITNEERVTPQKTLATRLLTTLRNPELDHNTKRSLTAQVEELLDEADRAIELGTSGKEQEI